MTRAPEFAPFVERRLGELGKSRADLARAVGVSPTAVWNWLANGRQPGTGLIEPLAAALRVDVPTMARLTGRVSAAIPGDADRSDAESPCSDAETPRARLLATLEELSEERIGQVADYADYLAMKDWRDEWQEAALARIASALDADQRMARSADR